jgi:hypothetical protein
MRVKNWELLLYVTAVCFSFELSAQNYFIEQAALFSRQNAGGSARIQAMGGAQVALGGDFSSGLSNPAGLGMYNRNEFAITPAFTLQNSNGNFSTYEVVQGNLTSTPFGSSASNSTLSLPGLSLVFGSNKNTDKAPFYGGTFAITLNRINDFNGALEYKGQNNGSSMIPYFIEVSQGFTIKQFDPQFDPNSFPVGNGDNVNTQAFLGYENALIEPYDDTQTITDVFLIKDYSSVLFGGKPLQSEIIKTSGSQNQWNLSYGANFSDVVYLGAGLGITSVRYQYDKTYTENFEGQTTGRANQCKGCFNNFVLKETRTTTGSGVNFTLGAIVKPIDFVQVGVSYITGTSYQLNDSYNGSMTSSWNNFDYYNNGKPLNNVSSKTIDDPVNYGLVTPGRFTFGTALFIPKKGFITADVELVNYSKASTNNFSQQDYTYQIDADEEVNSAVSSRFKSVTNIRVGGEYRFDKFRVRAGYSVMGDPYSRKPTERINYSFTNLSSITGGVGYRKPNLFIDLAIVYTQGDGYYVPYSLKNFPSPDYTYTNSTTRIMFTVGFPF